MIKLRTVLLITVLLIGCESKYDSDLKAKIKFNGITTTDPFGMILNRDTTDWKFNDIWDLKESSLFEEKRNSSCTLNILDYSITAYPNPCPEILYFELNLPTDFTISFRIVDRYYNLLYSFDNKPSKHFGILVSNFKITNDTIRIYYKLLKEDCELRGHGDIKIK